MFSAPVSLRTLAQEAFYGCVRLARVELNEGLETLGSQEYNADHRPYAGVFENSAVEMVGLPRSLERIEPNAFRNCKKLRHLDLRRGLRTIGVACFEDSGLESVAFPETLASVGNGAFFKCASLKQVFVEDGCKASTEHCVERSVLVGPPARAVAGDKSVWELRDLRQVVIPEGVERIGAHWFHGTDVETVLVASSIREIGHAAFRDCKRLKQVAFAEMSKLEKIETAAFAGSALESFEAPPGLRTLAQGAFFECAALKLARLNEGLAVLGTKEQGGEMQFYCGVFERSGLRTVSLPSTLVVVEENAFAGCKDLKGVELSAGLERMGRGCFRDSGIESMAVPKDVTEIPEYAFYHCAALKSVAFAEGAQLQTIGRWSFQGCGLEALVVPKCV